MILAVIVTRNPGAPLAHPTPHRGPNGPWGKLLTSWRSRALATPRPENRPAATPDSLRPGADLRGASLVSALLNGVDLTGADLRGADLRAAHLRGAVLDRADLSGALLRGADLRASSLREANLRRADLLGAFLRGAVLVGCRWSETTIWPDAAATARMTARSRPHPDGGFVVTPQDS